MDSERWEQIESLFLSAQQRDEAEREVFLAEACGGDQLLKSEVESLLAANDRPGPFMEEPIFNLGLKVLEVKEQGESLSGRSVGHYRILDMLGCGGMGTVYRAFDSKLKRPIALKVLPASFSNDPERVRLFKREAQAASRLTHHNVAVIHEIDYAYEHHYIAMELIDGLTLRQHMKEKPLELPKAIDITMQVAHALIAAHEKGVIHHDIKPENIMLTKDGLVKVLDFGIAMLNNWQVSLANQRAVETNWGGQATDIPWKVMGTISYMSPEQVRRQETNAPTDIWSLGVVLYEMISGELPFKGETDPDVQAAILKTEPKPLSEHLHEVPIKLEQIVSRMLCKNVDQRYQTIQQVLTDLQRLLKELEKSEQSSLFTPLFQKTILKHIALFLALLVIVIVAALGFRSLLKVSPAPSTEAQRSETARTRANIKDLSNTYGIVDHRTIFNKKTHTVFATPKEFFADSGMTSFDNLKFDEVLRLPTGMHFVNGEPIRPEGN
jgi:serine/threonine protein kinase